MLRDFVDNVAVDSHLRIDKDLGDGYFKLRASEAQRRQAQQDIRCNEDIIIEMLRNSRDAGAKNIYVATNTHDNARDIIIIDDGEGIPTAHFKTIFEPYVTSKLDSMTQDMWGVHGRGMALYSIKLNADKSYVVKSDKDIGSSIFVQTVDFNEKTDQSTFPTFFLKENSVLALRGPKNILRVVCEFAIENKNCVNVYVGSPTEIASTIYYQSENFNTIFGEPDSDTKITQYLAYSCDPKDFSEIAKNIGLTLSERGARRIIDGQIAPVASILERIAKQGITTNERKANPDESIRELFNVKNILNPVARKPKIKISSDDKELLEQAIKDAYESIADKYYLDPNIEPKMKVRGQKANISFEIINYD